jgi:hypothetical protein
VCKQAAALGLKINFGVKPVNEQPDRKSSVQDLPSSETMSNQPKKPASFAGLDEMAQAQAQLRCCGQYSSYHLVHNIP